MANWFSIGIVQYLFKKICRKACYQTCVVYLFSLLLHLTPNMHYWIKVKTTTELFISYKVESQTGPHIQNGHFLRFKDDIHAESNRKMHDWRKITP